METFISEKWQSEFMYESGGEGVAKSSKHIVQFTKGEHGLIGETVSSEDGSMLRLLLQYDRENHTLTGTWSEATSETGHYEGRIFHGAGQLLVNESGNTASGMWVGFNSRHTRVKAGEWYLRRV